MFNRFEVFMNEWLIPIAQKVDKQRHLSAIKAPMATMTLFTTLGGFFVIILALPDMIGENSAFSQLILNNAELLDLSITLSIGMVSVYVTTCVACNLGDHYEPYIPGYITLSTFTSLFMAAEDVEGGINITSFGAKGLFRTILAGMAATEPYRFCKEKSLTIRMPGRAPDSVSKSSELTPITITAAGTFIAVRFFPQQIFEALPPQILTQLLAPLVGPMDSPWAVLFLYFMICLIFFFGTRLSVFRPIIRLIMAAFVAENIIARQTGEPLSHFYTAGTSNAFFGFAGAGIIIGCVAVYVLSKSERYHKIGQVTLFPSPFGINEPILFGAPITLNPIMFIPFVLDGIIIGTMPILLVHYDLLDRPLFDPPYVGVSLEGLLINGDWRVILACGAQLILTTLLYLPFFKIMERQEPREGEAGAKEAEEAKNISSGDEEALLNDLDLDL